MKQFAIDMAYKSLNHYGEELCGDKVEIVDKEDSRILILADALFKIQMSVDAKRFGLALWWQILLIALVTGVIGVLVFIRPFEAAAAMMALVGFSILLEGILNLWVGILTIKIIKSRL